jgi:hypothetical protein
MCHHQYKINDLTKITVVVISIIHGWSACIIWRVYLFYVVLVVPAALPYLALPVAPLPVPPLPVHCKHQLPGGQNQHNRTNLFEVRWASLSDFISFRAG